MTSFSRALCLLPLSALLLAACGDEEPTDTTDAGRDTSDTSLDVSIEDGSDTDDDDSSDVREDSGEEDTSDTSNPDELDCTGILQCVQGCGTNATCAQGCIADGSDEAQGQFQDMAGCFQANCAEFQNDNAAFQECAISECGAEVSACTGQNLGVGDQSCSEVFACLSQPSCQNEACQTACLSEGTAAAQADAITLVTCIVEDCGGQLTENCLTDTCADQALACEEGGAPTASCDESLDCYLACEDAACGTDCVAATAEADVEAIEAITACADENCADLTGDERMNCLGANCGEAYTDCTGDTIGYQECGAAFGCMLACTDAGCVSGCVETVATASIDDAENLETCLNRQCDLSASADDKLACIAENCLNDAEACGVEASCSELRACAAACDSTECAAACDNLGTRGIVEAATALGTCIATNCAELADAELATCIETNCATEAAACE